MRGKVLASLLVFFMLFMISTQALAADETVINLSSIGGVAAPVKGATPVTTITETDQFTGTVTWDGNPVIFAADTVYTATITLTPKTGYTLTGVAENFFTVAGATATNVADSGVISVVFPKTDPDVVPDAVISIAAIGGVTSPARGATPVTTIAETTEYTGTVAWNGSPTTFAADTVYTATITLTPKAGYTLTGVAENFFTVAGADSVTNAADTGVITAVFPKTEPPAPPVLVRAATNQTGDIVTLTFDKAMADPSADVGSFAVKANGIRYLDTPVTAPIPISTVALNADPTKIDLTLSTPLQRGEIVTVDYTPGNVAAADAVLLAAFSAQPVTNTVPVVIDTNLVGTWQIFDHVGNWGEVNFPAPHNDPRGSAFNRHIVINGSTVYFYGNGINPFKDFLYLPSTEAAAKSFTFDLDLSGVKYHSMEGGGFLFNTKIEGGLLYGYCALFINNYGTYAVNLYQIDGIDVDTFHDGEDPYQNLGGDPTGITELESFPLSTGNVHSIRLEASSSTVDMWDGATKLFDNFPLPEVYSNGVGIIGSYQSHWCSELSWFIFSNLNIQGIADLEAVMIGSNANLTFTAPEGATSVVVEQSTDGVNWTPSTIMGTITEASTNTIVTGLLPNTTYYFRLDITGGKYDGYSRLATAIYEVRAIMDLAATPGNSIANLTFTPPVDALSLEVMQSTDGATWTPSTLSAPIEPTATTATVTGLTNGQLYYFKIVVMTGDEDSEDSNIASATPYAPSTPSYTPSYINYTLTIEQIGEGTVLPQPGDHTFHNDTIVMLIATPAEGYTFEGWTGTTGNSVYMDANKKITAVFKPIITEPVEEPEPTPTPTPTPEPDVVIEEETPPTSPGALPKTGGIPAALLCGLGGIITSAGLLIKRKHKKQK